MKNIVLQKQAVLFNKSIEIFKPIWTAHILLLLNKEGRLKYSQLENKLGIKPDRLTKTIAHLNKHGLLEKVILRKLGKPKTYYQLTEEGKFAVKNKIKKDVAYYKNYKARFKKQAQKVF